MLSVRCVTNGWIRVSKHQQPRNRVTFFIRPKCLHGFPVPHRKSSSRSSDRRYSSWGLLLYVNFIFVVFFPQYVFKRSKYIEIMTYTFVSVRTSDRYESNRFVGNYKSTTSLSFCIFLCVFEMHDFFLLNGQNSPLTDRVHSTRLVHRRTRRQENMTKLINRLVKYI